MKTKYEDEIQLMTLTPKVYLTDSRNTDSTD